MGMFDHYEPVPPIIFRGVPLSGWQGKDGPCKLLIWRQHSKAPVAHAVDEKWRASAEKLSSYRLSDGELEIYTGFSDRTRWFTAKIIVRDGVWIDTRLREEKDGDA